MIRIDEIYANVFGSWFEKNQPDTRLFFCSPFGHTDPEHLFTVNPPTDRENDYVFMHDQEPIDLELFSDLFDEVKRRNLDIGGYFNADNRWIQVTPTPKGHCIVSELGSRVEELKERYNFQVHYYFYHGWAALDWYRGYNHTYLIRPARERNPKRTFFSPNRTVAGRRDHRVLFLYNIFKNHLENNYISAPRVCDQEQIPIETIASKYNNIYPDIEQVFRSAELPRLFSGETTQRMSSYELTNFKEAEDSLIYAVTETIADNNRTHLTEKTFRPIALGMPFILIAPPNSLEYLKQYGFRTFHPYIDESYDQIEDPILRIEAATRILLEIQARSAAARTELWQQLLPIVEYNYNHFYSGGFESILWAELNQMLAEFNSKND